MDNALLVLCPDDPHWVPSDDEAFQQWLQSICLIGKPFNGPMHFLAGERFLEHIAFMGCAPDIRLEPGGDDQPFCHVRLITNTDRVEFHSGDSTHKPRCPYCRSPVDDWSSKVGQWLETAAESEWRCESCRRSAKPWAYNWRRSAGFGRCFIEISNIYPKEAVPQQQLLDALDSHYGASWHYFYQY